ncbi:hypothetical protein OG883_36405 [Streptomyces sp. NBC_01142]|uniref:hypothetical protein n=1 Tax=Streptomyces sp. NBC_01142 TaxID=2975865 RepID=UPI002255BEB2|nr:hypothetical protein [Streptomyces sp. NBC_01142]MCX4825248.1 hypothetical protein [Streptomyces sp. NBC_01142]
MSDSAEPARRDATPTVVEPVPDLQLQLLIRLLGQDPRSSLPITLNIPGGVLYGDLIAHEAWKADWAQSLRRMEGPGAHLLAKFPETVDQIIDELHGEDGNGSQGLPRWIHLRSVTIVTGAKKPVTSPLWRARLADISGWSLGKPA